MKQLLVLGICLALMAVFTPPDASAKHHRCGKVWVEGHYDIVGIWIAPHWKYKHWKKGHHNRHGDWIPGYCK